jgi:hypothetical protein
MNDVHKIVVEVARPRPPSFHGRVEVGYYVVTEGFVVLTDEQGRPVGDKQRIGDGDPRLIACVMLRRSRRRNSSFADFNAPISYRRSKYL